MKFLIFLFTFAFAAFLTGTETMTVYLTSGSTLYMRSSWDAKQDLLRVCSLGGNNKQFNFLYSSLVDKKVTDTDLMIRGKYMGRFHWCGDSVGVTHIYAEPPRTGIYILSGNHGYSSTEITLPDHGCTKADIGKKMGSSWIAAIVSKDKFKVVPSLPKAQLPKGAEGKTVLNFRGTRLLSRTYLLDGQPLTPGKILKGKSVTVLEKTGICLLEPLAAKAFQHDKVEDFYSIWDYAYNFFPNGSCRVDHKITITKDTLLMGISTMQDSDMEIGKTYTFYEKYIPKMKKFRQSPTLPWKGSQAYVRQGGKMVADSREYDFEGVQDMTQKKTDKKTPTTRFEIQVKGGFVDPADLPDRWIDFMGKTENGKRVRKIGNVLGIDPEFGIGANSERAKNNSVFIIPNWHKTYPTQYSHGKKVIKKGTVLEGVGYRCYFNPETIGDATALFSIPHKDGVKIYADFHKSVKDYTLPFAANAQVKILEKTPSVTLKGNKLSVNGSYGRIVVKVAK